MIARAEQCTPAETMGQHKAEKLSYQIQLLQQMRQINKEGVSHL